MDNTDNIEKYRKYLKIGSWIATAVVIICMLASVVSSKDFDQIIDSAKSQDSIDEYLNKKYSNIID